MLRALVLVAVLLVTCRTAQAWAPQCLLPQQLRALLPGVLGGACRKVRFATYNTSLNRNAAGQLADELASKSSEQAKAVAKVLQTVRPDVVLLNEFDYQEGNAQLLQQHYLGVCQGPALAPLHYPYHYVAPVNTGVLSGRDLNKDGKVELPEDGYGFGRHPGQYGMLLLSRFPIESSAVRTFQQFLWKDMPGADLPKNPNTGEDWFDEGDLQVYRLSSKSHWDVPLSIPAHPCKPPATVHALVSHPTPPLPFNATYYPVLRARNTDEIRLWADYVGCGPAAAASGSEASGGYLVDDQGRQGGLAPGASFVIMGDQNCDPVDGAGAGAINMLLKCPAVGQDPAPNAPGGEELAQRRPDKVGQGPPKEWTSEFFLRVDYVLPSRGLKRLGGAVVWPRSSDPLTSALNMSDHRPVYADLMVCS